MTRKFITGNRLRNVYKRQKSPPWDRNYLPGILATRDEAPDISRASILTPSMLGRRFHCLSEPEKYLAIFGFYSERFAGVQEQRMMPAHPIPHPLFTMPGVVDKRLPVLPGTLAIAEKIGATNILTTGSLPADNEGDESLKIIIPFFSDILWAIREPDGSVNKCINWNIKDEQEAFSLPAPQRRRGKASAESDRDRTVARHTLERLYYEEAGIRTVQIGLDQLDETFRENLRRLFGQHRRRITLDEQLQRALKEHFATALQAGVPPFEVILDLKRRHQFDIHDARTLLWQLIWRRELRVDLFSTLLIDRPLKPESIDPLEKYADWFRG